MCCGTGDLMRALQRRRPGGVPVMASDFCHPMLVAARAKFGGAALVEADALQLPLRARSLDLITVAFGFRNLANYDAGLREMRRVLRNGGVAAILEFSQPPNAVFGALYRFYSQNILPVVGGALSRVAGRLPVPAGVGAKVSLPGGVGGIDARGGIRRGGIRAAYGRDCRAAPGESVGRWRASVKDCLLSRHPDSERHCSPPRSG
jgi:SAM-dependent methyltransferase